MPSGERLPEQDADGPDVACRSCVLAPQPLGRDVGERPRNVADGGERVRAVELREPEVEELDRDRVGVLEQDVRRLDVAVDDARPMCVRQRLEHLSRDLDRLVVADVVGAKRLADGAAGDVLVCDVHVPRVVADVVRAHAVLMPEAACGERLAFGASGRLALAGHDLQRDVESGLLVAREPHGAVAAAPERPDGSVAVEDELRGRKGVRERRHRCGMVIRPCRNSFGHAPWYRIETRMTGAIRPRSGRLQGSSRDLGSATCRSQVCAHPSVVPAPRLQWRIERRPS